MAKKTNAVCYVECSSLTGAGVREVFRTATICGLGTLLKEKERQRGCIVM